MRARDAVTKALAKKNPVNVLFINDSSSNPNWGDRAAAIALKQMIRESGGTIEAAITEDELRDTGFSGPAASEAGDKSPANGRSNRDWARLLLPPVVFKLRDRISSKLGARRIESPIPRTVEEFEPCAERVMRDPDCARLVSAIGRADVVVVHGDGCMTGNGILPRSELFLCYVIKTRFDVPVALVNHTTDFEHSDLNGMAELVYPKLDDVTYRDEVSAGVCRPRWSGRYAADSAFLFEPAQGAHWASLASRPTYFDVWPDYAPFLPTQPYICVGGSSIFSFSGVPTEVIDSFVALLSHLRKFFDGQIVLTASDIKDEMIFRSVAKVLDLPLVGLRTPVQQAVDIVGNAQAYIGGRWHPSIFALRGGVPVIPLSSKTFKMQALIAMAGMPNKNFDALDLTSEKQQIGEALLSALEQGDTLRTRLRTWAATQATNAWENVALVRRQSDAALQRPAVTTECVTEIGVHS